MALSGGCELEHADTGVGFGSWLVSLWGVWDEVGIHEDDQVERRLGDLLGAWTPAEVSELCRTVSLVHIIGSRYVTLIILVDVDVALGVNWCRLIWLAVRLAQKY